MQALLALVLACSVLLKAGDFVDDKHLFTPADEWQRQQARTERVQHQVQRRLQALVSVRVLDAAYHVHPDVGVVNLSVETDMRVVLQRMERC